MRQVATRRGVSIMVWAYNCLLQLYPGDYRAHFADEMIVTFERAREASGERGRLGSVHFACLEFAGLLIGAGAEWKAKLSSDRSTRGRSLPDLRMMRPPGVLWELWFSGTAVDATH